MDLVEAVFEKLLRGPLWRTGLLMWGERSLRGLQLFRLALQLLFLFVFSDFCGWEMRATVIMSLPSGPWHVCHTEESLLSLVSSLSPNLLWPLACVHAKQRKGKTSNWPSSTWQGDVAKKKTTPEAGWETAEQGWGGGRWRRSGRRQIYFPLCWFNRVEKGFEEDLGTQKTKSEPSLLGMKVVFVTQVMIINGSKGMIDRLLFHWKPCRNSQSSVSNHPV